MTEEAPKYLSTDERRREIAAAARALILEKGFEGLRTREIAARVGINIATLHYHVPTKDALIELVGQSLRDDFRKHDESIARRVRGPLDQLRALIDDYKDVMTNRPELLQLLDAMGHRAAIDPKTAAIMGDMRRHWHGQFVAALAAGRDQGEFRADLDPDAAAHMIIGALVSFQYKPKHLLPLFDRVAAEIIRSIKI